MNTNTNPHTVEGIKAAKKSAFVRRAGQGKSQDSEWIAVSRGKAEKTQGKMPEKNPEKNKKH